MAVLYKTDGIDIEITPKDKEQFTLEELQGLVGGMIEMLDLPSGKCMIINEEGKLIGLLKNNRATNIWKKEYPIEKYPNNNDELIVGNALVCEQNELQ